MFPIDEIPSIQRAPDSYRLLQRVPWTEKSATFPRQIGAPIGDEISCVWLDTETTGFNATTDKIIEFGMVKGLVSQSTGQVAAITAMTSLYEDPGFPIPEIITTITGITDAMVQGQSIDGVEVLKWFDDDPVVIAHSASFDRPFFEARFNGLDRLRWACTIKDISWPSFGFESSKLEYLLLKLGFFYEGHRASIDALATAYLMHSYPEASRQLIENENEVRVKIDALGSPFSVKDELKARGYSWDAPNKVWHKETNPDDRDSELAFLSQAYAGGGDRARQTVLSSRERYKGGA
jgi:DNA polymerase-3 subunit epsilon